MNATAPPTLQQGPKLFKINDPAGPKAGGVSFFIGDRRGLGPAA
jgi:hypothetical protein